MLEEQGGELAHAAIPLVQERQRVEVLRLCERMCFGHRRLESGPRQHCLDGGKGIAAAVRAAIKALPTLA